MERRHGNTAGHHAVRGFPEIGFREVVAKRISVENYLGDHAVGPLVFEQGQDLLLGPLLVVVRVANCDEPGIPVPLMRIEARRRLGIRTSPVVVQYLSGGLDIFSKSPQFSILDSQFSIFI